MIVVSSHYKEDLSWMENPIISKKYNFSIYSKTDKTKNYIDVNKGNESTSYLKFIIDNYDSLPEHLFFIHGHDKAYHQDFTMTEILKNFKITNKTFISLNRRDWYVENMRTQHTTEYNMLLKNWSFNDLPIPDQLSYYSCAQFYTNSCNIKKNPLELYKKMFEWLITTNINNYWSSRFFEYTWYYILTHNNIEEKNNYEDFLTI